MLITFFDVKGLAFHPQDQNMNQTVHKTHLECSGGEACWSSLINGLWGTCLLHPDNVPCSVAFSVTEFMVRHSTPKVPHQPYSPGMAPCDFFVFSQLKTTLKGKWCKMSGNTTEHK
jgi:hypothetical protein